MTTTDKTEVVARVTRLLVDRMGIYRTDAIGRAANRAFLVTHAWRVLSDHGERPDGPGPWFHGACDSAAETWSWISDLGRCSLVYLLSVENALIEERNVMREMEVL